MNNDPDAIIENAVSELYRGLFLLRTKEKYDDELRIMETIIKMLQEDQKYLREFLHERIKLRKNIGNS